jgi:hypothetical protein
LSKSRVQWLLAGALVVALVLTAAASGGVAAASAVTKVRDKKADTKALKRKPELDIRRVLANTERDGRVRFRITMQGRLKPNKKFTRPFVLINTRGGNRSRFEYMALGPRVFKRVNTKKEYRKVGANQFSAKRKTWVYRFQPEPLGLGPGDSFGFAVLTSKGKTSDLAPDRRYRNFEIDPS